MLLKLWAMVDLKIESKAILAYLVDRCGDNDMCWPARETICGDLGITAKRFHRFLKPLVDKGLIRISKFKTKCGQFQNCSYYLCVPKLGTWIHAYDNPPCTQIGNMEGGGVTGDFTDAQVIEISRQMLDSLPSKVIELGKIRKALKKDRANRDKKVAKG